METCVKAKEYADVRVLSRGVRDVSRDGISGTVFLARTTEVSP